MTAHDENLFIAGLDLCDDFYHELVAPVMERHFSSLPYSAGLIGSGSEVLGFDTALSTDHDWGPRVMLFLKEEDAERYGSDICNFFARNLPSSFKGYSTSFSAPSEQTGSRVLEDAVGGDVAHRIEVQSLSAYINSYLGFDIEKQPSTADWLSFPQQKLRALTAGRMFHDQLEVDRVRSMFSFYPHDVWLYLLACAWHRVGQEDHLMGRAGSVGDEIGSAIIGARLVRDLMRIAFLLQRTYAPYPKWFGTAFKGLSCSPQLESKLQAALHATDWKAREEALCSAYEAVAELQNELKIVEPMPTNAVPFFGRPFRVIGLQGYANQILGEIQDPEVKRVAARTMIGGVDQFSDSTDMVENSGLRRVIAAFY